MEKDVSDRKQSEILCCRNATSQEDFKRWVCPSITNVRLAGLASARSPTPEERDTPGESGTCQQPHQGRHTPGFRNDCHVAVGIMRKRGELIPDVVRSFHVVVGIKMDLHTMGTGAISKGDRNFVHIDLSKRSTGRCWDWKDLTIKITNWRIF